MTLLGYHAWQLFLLTVLGGALVARLEFAGTPSWSRRWLDGWALPLAAGLIGAAALWYMWGTLAPLPYIHDESAYLLQAEMLARGSFAGPGRPLPEFFEQFHLFVTPVLAARYPPGWALALVPGIWIGLPALVPMLLTGASAALVVLLVRRVAGSAAAILALVLWIGAPIETRFRATFLSEHLTVLLWLVGWWALWNWRDDRRLRWLVLLSVATAWMGITRPLTGVAYALPVGIVVLFDVVKRKLWRQLAIACAAGLPLCALVPLQNKAVMGEWGRTPTRAYSDIYTPYDLPGLGLDVRKPVVAPNADRRAFGRVFRPTHAEHVAERLPEILWTRWTSVLRDSAWRWGTAGFALLLLIGVTGAGSTMAFAGLSTIALMLGYLWFAHPAGWTVYYMEAHVVLVAAVAVGVGRVTDFVGGLRIFSPRTDDSTRSGRRRAVILVGLALFVAPDAIRSVEKGKSDYAMAAAPHFRLASRLSRLPRSILFIRYAPDHNVHRGLIENHPDLDATTVWRVHDLGGRNAELIRLAPDRSPWLYDEGSDTIFPLAPDGVTPAHFPAPATSGR